jgi:hypothetical protein
MDAIGTIVKKEFIANLQKLFSNYLIQACMNMIIGIWLSNANFNNISVIPKSEYLRNI